MRDTRTLPSAEDVAAAIIETRPGVDQMQLHKLLYLVQAAHLSWLEGPAFSGRIEAWKWGPVVRGVAGTYMQYESIPIQKPESGRSEQLPTDTRWVVKRVVEEFGNLSGPDLARITKDREGSPWRAARGDLPEGEPS